MGGILSGPKAPDNSAALAEIERNRKETERVTKEAQDDRRTLSEQKMAKKRASRYGGNALYFQTAGYLQKQALMMKKIL